MKRNTFSKVFSDWNFSFLVLQPDDILSGGISNGIGGPGSSVNDPPVEQHSVTPLKKRRLQNYKEDQEQSGGAGGEAAAAAAAAAGPVQPGTSSEPQDTTAAQQQHNCMKKKLMQSLVLEAVLDRAMEDMLATSKGAGASAAAGGSGSDSESGSLRSPVPNKSLTESPLKSLTASPAKSLTEVSSPLAHTNTKSEPVKPEDDAQPKTEPEIAQESTSEAPALPTSSIPEPTSVFKSFFKSSVSLEALEAEIEASKKQREAEQQKLAELSVDAQSPLPSLRPFSPPMAQVKFLL